MNAIELLVDAFGRIREDVRGAVEGLSADQLSDRLGVEANPVAWLVWHLTRVQDDHVADLAGSEQMWTADGWADRFGLSLPVGSTGYGHRSADVQAVHVDSPDLLTGYHDAVHDRTVEYLRTLSDTDLDRVLDDSYDPPVTVGVRLVSVVNDDTQHAGQAAYAAGIVAKG